MWGHREETPDDHVGTQGGDVARESGFGGNRPAHTWLTKDRIADTSLQDREQ